MSKLARVLGHLMLFFVVFVFVFGLFNRLAHAQDFDIVLSLSGNVETSFGRGTTYASHLSLEWTPDADVVVCSVTSRWRQETGNRTQNIGLSVREGMTSNPETGGTVISTATIYAADIDTITTDLNTPLDTCFLARSGIKYAFDFSTGDDATNYLWGYIFLSDQLPNTQNWDFVQVSGWTARPTREMYMLVYGTEDFSQFSDYASSSYAFTDPDFGWFGNALLDVLKYLFVPSYSSQAQLTAKKDELMTKAPFGWFSMASSTLAELGDTSSTSAYAFDVPVEGVGTSTVTFFDKTAITDLIPDNVESLIQTLGAMMIWTFFFVWVFNLARSNPETEL